MTKPSDAPERVYTVEIIKYGTVREEDEAAFTDYRDAVAFARRMKNAHYRVWIDNVEFSVKDISNV